MRLNENFMVIGKVWLPFQAMVPIQGVFIFSVLPAPAELRGRAQAGLFGCAQEAISAFGCFLLE